MNRLLAAGLAAAGAGMALVVAGVLHGALFLPGVVVLGVGLVVVAVGAGSAAAGAERAERGERAETGAT